MFFHLEADIKAKEEEKKRKASEKTTVVNKMYLDPKRINDCAI